MWITLWKSLCKKDTNVKKEVKNARSGTFTVESGKTSDFGKGKYKINFLRRDERCLLSLRRKL